MRKIKKEQKAELYGIALNLFDQVVKLEKDVRKKRGGKFAARIKSIDSYKEGFHNELNEVFGSNYCREKETLGLAVACIKIKINHIHSVYGKADFADIKADIVGLLAQIRALA